MDEHVLAHLTTDSPASSHGLYVMRLEGPEFKDSPDLGPADLLPSGMTAAELCCKTFYTQTEKAKAASRAFCSQWIEGPQPGWEEN